MARFDSEDNRVHIHVADASCNNIGLTHEELLDRAEEAADQYWNRVSSSQLELIRGEIINVNETVFRNDPICQSGNPNGDCQPTTSLISNSGIIISCNINSQNFENINVLGITLPNNIQGSVIQSSLILINDQTGGGGTSQWATLSREKQVSVLAHEIGHAIGLGHSNDTDALMYFEAIDNRKDLGKDDIDGITFLYPA